MEALVERLLYREALEYCRSDRTHTVCCDASNQCPTCDIEPGNGAKYSEVEEEDADFGDVDGDLVKHLAGVEVLRLLANLAQSTVLRILTLRVLYFSCSLR